MTGQHRGKFLTRFVFLSCLYHKRLAALQKSKSKETGGVPTVETLQEGAIAAVSTDKAEADAVVIVKQTADSPAVLVSSDGTSEAVKLEQTASGTAPPNNHLESCAVPTACFAGSSKGN